MRDVWSKWVAHDGGSVPSLPYGTIVERRFDRRCVNNARPQDGPCLYHTGPLHPDEVGSWTGDPEVAQVIRYRWKRPPAVLGLMQIAASVRQGEPVAA